MVSFVDGSRGDVARVAKANPTKPAHKLNGTDEADAPNGDEEGW
jgi:hypothetical protein